MAKKYDPERINCLLLIILSGIANSNLIRMAKLALPTVGYMLRPTGKSDEEFEKTVQIERKISIYD